jgi:hypothetical protein
MLRYAIKSTQKYEAQLIVLHVLEVLSPTASALSDAYLNKK